MKSFIHAFCHECAIFMHSKGALSMFIIGILFYSWLYPTPYAYEIPQKLPVMAVDKDNSTSSRSLLRIINSTEGISLNRTDDIPSSINVLRSGKCAGLIVIPQDFERNLLTCHGQNILLYCDAAHLLLYRMVLQGVRQSVENFGAGVRILQLEKKGIPESIALQLQKRGRPDLRLLYNPAGNYGRNTVPPVFILILQQILISGCAMLEVSRKTNHIKEEDVAWFLGRMFLPLCLSIIFSVYYLRILVNQYDLIYESSFGDILVFLLPFFLACSALGNFIGRFFCKESHILPIVLPLSLPMLFLSGFVWPMEAMPQFFRAFGQILPSTPAITGYLLLAERSAGLPDIASLWIQLWSMFLLILSIVLFFIRKNSR